MDVEVVAAELSRACTVTCNPVVDGFGLIAFASLTPIVFVLLYGMLS